MRREYEGRVNFVWVYGLEAHPEEIPFVRGFETIDLGWTHPYFITTTMRERAQRAAWMKTDLEPDAGMPMMIDYINSDLGPDNAIKQAFWGAGFYSGAVIDCNGQILFRVGWGWHTGGGEWWGLPLAAAEELRGFLDAYLGDPTSCYEPPGDPPEPPLERLSTVLVVDDDEGRPYEGYFTIPIGNLMKPFDVWDVQWMGSPPAETLQAYPTVVWLTGDATTSTLTPADQANLTAYLDTGGELLLSGQNVADDIGESDFHRDYLHATPVSDAVVTEEVLGVDLLAPLEFTLAGSDGAENQDSPAVLSLVGTARPVARYNTVEPTAWAGVRWEGDYQVAYLGFGVEGIGDRGAGAFRFRIMQEIFAWFASNDIAGDVNHDGALTFEDIALFATCMSGPDVLRPAPTCRSIDFIRADLDHDGDADLADVAALQTTFADT